MLQGRTIPSQFVEWNGIWPFFRSNFSHRMPHRQAVIGHLRHCFASKMHQNAFNGRARSPGPVEDELSVSWN